MNLYDIESELASLRAENAALREQITRHCERIASQADALSRAAERSATARLEAWAKVHLQISCRLCIERDSGHKLLTLLWFDGDGIRGWLHAYCRPFMPRRDHSYPVETLVVGTDEKPATLDEMIDAALKRWKELYGTSPG